MIVALIEIGGIGILDVVHDVLYVVLPLNHSHGQVGHGGGQGQHFTDLDLIDIIAGVHGQQFLGGHAVVLGDLGPGVALDDGVGDLLLLGAVQSLGQVAQIHDLVGGDQLLLDLHILGKGAGDGVLIRRGAPELTEQFIQRPLIGRGADQLAVYIQAVRGSDHTQFLRQVLLQSGLVHHLLAGDQTVGKLQQGIVDGIGLTQGPGGDLLQIGADLLRGGLGIHHGHHLAVVADSGAKGIEGEEQHHCGHAAGTAQKHGRMEPVRIHPAAHAVHALMDALAAGQGPFAQQPRRHGHQTPEKQQQRQQRPVGLRETLGSLLPHNVAPTAPGQAVLRGENLPQNDEGALGALLRPQVVPEAVPMLLTGLRPLLGQRLLRPGGNGGLNHRLGLLRLLAEAVGLPPCRLRGNRRPTGAASALTGLVFLVQADSGFFHITHIVSCDNVQEKSYNLLPFHDTFFSLVRQALSW